MHKFSTAIQFSHLNLSRKDNGNDESIDSHSLAEDDRDEVLGLDPGCLDAAANDAGSSRVDAKGSTNNTEVSKLPIKTLLGLSVVFLCTVPE